MKVITTLLCTLLVLLSAGSVRAAPSASGSYSSPAATVDVGGLRSTSSRYTNDGGVGGIAGMSVSDNDDVAITAKAGYIGQLYETASLELTSSPATVNESATSQLSAAQILDDSTKLAVAPASVTWSILAGPFQNISAGGLASAGPVYQDTAGSVQGNHEGLSRTLDITVLNVTEDDFGSYASDGIEDDWQVQHFGMDNPLAGPLRDVDGDGQDNLFEFTAGLIPTDAGSRFELSVSAVAGEPSQKQLIFAPRLADRSYTIEASDSLLPDSWLELTGLPHTDNGSKRTVTDTGASEGSRFYRVIIGRP